MLKEFLNNIFDDQFQKIISLPKDLKNKFYYNDKIYELLENYTSQLIQEKPLKDLNNFFSIDSIIYQNIIIFKKISTVVFKSFPLFLRFK